MTVAYALRAPAHRLCRCQILRIGSLRKAKQKWSTEQQAAARRLGAAPSGSVKSSANASSRYRVFNRKRWYYSHTLVARRSPPSAQGASEGVKSRVHPSSKAASEAVAVSHTAAAERRPLECKKRYRRLSFSQTPQKGYGEKHRGVSPRGAKRTKGRLPTGNRAGRGMAGISHAVKPCIKSANRGSNSLFTVRTGLSTIAVQKGRVALIRAQGVVAHHD